MKLNKKLSLFFGSLILGLFILSLNGGRAEAATLAIGGGCTLAEAVDSVNEGMDLDGCVKTGPSYGTDDTINLPAGTTTLTADLLNITQSVRISGVGKAETIVDMDGHKGFNAVYPSPFSTKNITIEKMHLQDAAPHAIDIQNALTVTLEALEVSDSNQGASVTDTTNLVVKDMYVHDNSDSSVDQNKNVGLRVGLAGSIEGGEISMSVEDFRTSNNSGDYVGLHVSVTNFVLDSNEEELLGDAEITLKSVAITNNTARSGAGLYIVSNGGPISTNKIGLDINATTIADNTVTVTSPQQPDNQQYLPVISGFMVTGVLKGDHHFTNVTIANNIVNNPAPDTRNSSAGFLASLGIAGSNLTIRNTTVVGNKVTQPSSAMSIPAFFATKIGLDENYSPNAVEAGSSATNVLIAQNFFNSAARSCWSDLSTEQLIGVDLGALDITPVNLGFNMSDDQSCTDYQYVPGLYDTIEHEVKDNGGSVPTIALLPGSPAINGGGQVQGITTDARGVARTGYYSVGAYQGELLAATTDGQNGTLANTGTLIAVISGLAAAVIVLAVIASFIDYKRHKRPLVEADPHASQTYTYKHHVSAVTIPVLRYRIHISLSRQPKGISRF